MSVVVVHSNTDTICANNHNHSGNCNQSNIKVIKPMSSAVGTNCGQIRHPALSKKWSTK